MNARELAQRLAERAQAVCEHLLPNGRKSGSEWKAGNVQGERGDSLAVRLTGEKRGVWSDFASGESGDLLDLWAACRGLSIAEALRDAKAFLGVRDTLPQRPAKTYVLPKKPSCSKPAGRAIEWLRKRGLSDDTIAAFQLGERIDNNKAFVVLPYLRDGALINAKTRDIDDKRNMRQEAGAEPCLFGWHLIDPKTRRIAITEGEFDAMVLHQVGIPAVSVNAGAGNHQWIDSDWERLERFDEILLCFDADVPGQKGAVEVAQRLGIERCAIVTFGAHKDANDALLAGFSSADFVRCCAQGRALQPDELKGAADFADQVLARFYPATDAPRNAVLQFGGRRYPWFEFRPREVTVWTGISGHGKSLMLGQVLLGAMREDECVCLYSGEMQAAETLRRMVRQAAGMERPTADHIKDVMRWIGDRLWVFDVHGSAKLDRLLEVFSYAARRYGVRHVVIDSLMMLEDVPEDGPGALSAQKEAMRKIVAFAQTAGVHAHLVAHPRKARDESSAPGKLDVAGSSKITDAAANVFSVWSARKDEDETDDGRPDAMLELHKQRNGDEQHRKLSLWFDKRSQQFLPTSDRKVMAYVPATRANEQDDAARAEYF